MADPTDPWTKVGRGVVQANLRLAKVLDLLLQPAAPDQSHTHDIVFDLLDALHLAAPHVDDAVALGLNAAKATAHAALKRQGVEPLTTSGLINPLHHTILGTHATSAPQKHGHIAAVHRLGWRRGHDQHILRTVHVTVFRLESSP
jgi:hypothetical protein